MSGKSPQPDQTGVCVIGLRPGGAAARAGCWGCDRACWSNPNRWSRFDAVGNKNLTGSTVEVSYRRDGENKLAHVVFDKTDVNWRFATGRCAAVAAGMTSDHCEDTQATALKVPPYPFRKQAQAMSRGQIEMLLGERSAAVALQGTYSP